MRKWVAAVLLLLPAAATIAAEWKGRALASVLDELRASGLKIVYTTQVVTADLVVVAEPAAADPVARLEEILRPHRLTVARGAAGLLLVVPQRDVPSDPQTAELRGEVTSRGTAVAGARVTISRRTTSTDGEGKFSVSGLQPGTHRLRITKSGFVIHEQEVDLPVAATLQLELIQAEVDLADVVVTPSQTSMFDESSSAARHLSREDIERIPHLADDLFRAIGRLPGTASGDISAAFHVRGGRADELLVRLDGVDLPEPFHLKDFQSIFSVVDAESVGTVDFMPGGFPVQYGDRLSGVLDLTSASAESQRQTEAGVSFINSRLQMKGTAGRGEYLLSIRRGYLDVVLDLVQPDINVDPEYFDAFGKVHFTLGNRHSLLIDGFTVRDRFVLDDDGESVDARYGSDLVWMNLRSAWSSRVDSEIVVHGGTFDRRRSGGIDNARLFGIVADERDVETAGIRQDWTLRLSEKSVARAGAELTTREARYDFTAQSVVRDPFLRTLFPNRTQDLRSAFQRDGTAAAAWISDRLRLSPKLVAEAGVRWDHQDWTGESQWSPRLNLAWSPLPSASVRVAWGRYAQAQAIDELAIGDGELDYAPAEHSTHLMLSGSWVRDGTSVRADVYEKRIDDPRTRYDNLFDPVELFPEIGFDRVTVRADSSLIRGAELLIERSAGERLQWWLSYTWSRATDRIDGTDVLRPWDQTHAFAFSTNLTLRTNWNLNLAGSWRSGWPTTDVDAEIVTLPGGAWELRPFLGARNGERLPPYYRVDMRASRDLPLRRGSMRFFLEIYNIFNRKNPCCVTDFTVVADGERFTVEEHPNEQLGWLPSFGVTWEF